MGTPILARMEPGGMTPRSKLYAIKYHWFRFHLKPNMISVEKIATDSQHADILTKGLTQATFKNIQKLLCGWYVLCLRGSESTVTCQKAMSLVPTRNHTQSQTGRMNDTILPVISLFSLRRNNSMM